MAPGQDAANFVRMGDGAGFLRVAHEPFHSERRVDPQLTQKVQAA